MFTMDALRGFSPDVDEALNARLMGNETLFLRLVDMMFAEDNFTKLESAVAAGDLTAAYEVAHALKGVTANLALTPLYQPVAAFSDLLKARVHEGKTDLPEDAPARLQQILNVKEQLRALGK